MIAALTAVVVATSMLGASELPLVAQYGLLAPLVGALVYVYKREATRSDRLEEEVRKLNTATQEKTIPAIVEVTAAMKHMVELVADWKMQQEVERRARQRGET